MTLFAPFTLLLELEDGFGSVLQKNVINNPTRHSKLAPKKIALFFTSINTSYFTSNSTEFTYYTAIKISPYVSRGLKKHQRVGELQLSQNSREFFGGRPGPKSEEPHKWGQTPFRGNCLIHLPFSSHSPYASSPTQTQFARQHLFPLCFTSRES